MAIKRFYHSSEAQFSPSEVESFVAKYGNDILIGGDPGHEDFERTMEACDKNWVYKHVYLVGPGMMSWSAEERDEIRRNARSVGIDTNSSDWQDRWYKQGGWEKKVYEWFTAYNSKLFYSAEIDNLDSVWEQDPNQYMSFILRFQNFANRNKIRTKLMLKNLSEEQLEALTKAFASGQVRKDLIAEFGMFEEGSGDNRAIMRLCKDIGIVAVTPLNGMQPTTRYATVREGIPYFTT